MKETAIWAHRGDSSRAPENTMASFELALSYGVQGIETDLHLTKDDVLVITHDMMLGRTVDGHEWIRELNWKELSGRDCGSWFHRDFRNERPLRLEDFLDWAAPSELLLNLEIKGGFHHYPTMEEKLINCLKNYKLQDRVLISSFNHHSLLKLHRLAPEYSLGVLTASLLVAPQNYVQNLGAQAYHPDYRAVLPEDLQACSRMGIATNCYTVDESSDMERLLEWGVDGLITNRPLEALEIKSRLDRSE